MAVSPVNSHAFAVHFRVAFVVFTGICATSLIKFLFIHASNAVGDTSPLNLVAGRAFTVFMMSSTCHALFALPNAPKNGIRLDKSKAVPSVAVILGYFVIKSDICCRYSSGTFSTIVPKSLVSHSVIEVTHVSGLIRGLARFSISPTPHNTVFAHALAADAHASKLVSHKFPL